MPDIALLGLSAPSHVSTPTVRDRVTQRRKYGIESAEGYRDGRRPVEGIGHSIPSDEGCGSRTRRLPSFSYFRPPSRAGVRTAEGQ